jgi:hypothetical protein
MLRDEPSTITDIRQIPGGFQARIAFLTALGNGKLPFAARKR